jgi:xanthine/CO dehydrogenase XdhC/CoxF family maturation factor
MRALRQIIDRVRSRPQTPWALATLVETEGSTYRKPGARLLADATGGTCLGILSGGCLEEEVAAHAPELIAGAPPRLLTFDTRKLYGCDGLVRIFVERLPAVAEGGNLVDALGLCLDRRKRCRIATTFRGAGTGSRLLGAGELVVQGASTFVHDVPLPVRLLLFGSGPEIEPIREIAATLGWVAQQCRHPDELPDDFKKDPQTAALVMTHNFGRDLAVLDRLLPFELPYLGLLGPRKRHRQILAELSELGRLDLTTLGPLHSPAGLDIGSESPEEIALAIVSEVSAVLAGRHGGHLRDRATAIHSASAAERRVA